MAMPSKDTIQKRISRGWTKEHATSIPVVKKWSDSPIPRKIRKCDKALEYNGEIKTISQWAREFGFEPKVIFDRLKKGVSLDVALSTPTRGYVKHGLFAENRDEYQSWISMHHRCSNMKERNYGGRGITVCARWNKFENFLSDMGKRPEKYSLDRINTNGNYERSNCRWADFQTQCNNRRTTKYIQFKNERKTLQEWANALNISATGLLYRLRQNWPKEKIFKPLHEVTNA